MERSLGKTCVTMTPRACSPSSLMNPPEALFDRVTTWTFDPADRIAFTALAVLPAEPMIITAWASLFATLSASAVKSGLSRGNFSRNRAFWPTLAKPFAAPAAESAPKESSVCSTATRVTPVLARCSIALAASRW